MKFALKFIGLIFGVQAAFGAASVAAQDRQVPTSNAQVQLSYAPLVQDAAPAVVNIYTKKVVRQKRSAMFDDPFLRRFFGDKFSFGMPEDRVRGSLGSGVIVRDTGVIVTNNHVIQGADEITVVLSDRREFDAKVVLADPRTDLAILKVDTNGEALKTIALKDSDQTLVGDIVLAIGNPFGIGQTVTSGIVSATARTQQGISDFGFFIQTDAAVNPGNSGGALIGLDGSLLGINTAIYSRTGASNGIGFAIPANMVKSVIRAALNEGQLSRPWLGVQGQTVTNALASGIGLDRPGGVLIDNVYPNGPAAQAGLLSGDVIMAVDDKEIIDEGALDFRIATKQRGEDVKLIILRNGVLTETTVNLDLPPEDPARSIIKIDGRHPFQGITVGNLSPRFNEELQIDTFLKGAVILRIDRRTPSGRYRWLEPGDIFVSINNKDVREVSDLEAIFSEPESRYIVRFLRRGRENICDILANGSFRCEELR